MSDHADRSHSRTPARQRARGMTLMELMLATMIVALMMAVVVPRMAATGRGGRLRSAARQLVSLMRVARSTAVFSELEVDLRFRPELGLYALSYDAEELERQRLVASMRRGRRLRERQVEAAAVERHHEWRRVRELPRGGGNMPAVWFEAVETELEVPSDVERHDFLPAIVFFPDGTASAGTIVLEGDRGNRLSIEIFTATATAVVHNGDIRDERRRDLR